MPAKKPLKNDPGQAGKGDPGDTTLVEVARTIGTTLGTAAAKAEGAAKDIGTFSRAMRKSTVTASRKLYKSAKKSLHAGAASPKTGAKKRGAAKKPAGKKSGRSK